MCLSVNAKALENVQMNQQDKNTNDEEEKKSISNKEHC